eukprot:TRINITY_DN23376_c0_g1_i1.p1 TRINITY_DN23376_c0_g1~~TRINITY_DN23376_c0_g1_i1.p1  ORF type:complete len:267 (-),score=16.61 TRINITY_DN23376_c0_g1_i1:161-961(-)
MSGRLGVLSGSFGEVQVGETVIMAQGVPEWTGVRNYEGMHFATLSSSGGVGGIQKVSRMPLLLTASAAGKPSARLGLSFRQEYDAREKMQKNEESLCSAERERFERQQSKEATLEWENPSGGSAASSRRCSHDAKTNSVVQVTGASREDAVRALEELSWETPEAIQRLLERPASSVVNMPEQTVDVSPPMVTIQVRQPSGGDLTMSLKSTDTVWDLKSRIYSSVDSSYSSGFSMRHNGEVIGEQHYSSSLASLRMQGRVTIVIGRD